MKFIHAIVMDTDEFNALEEHTWDYLSDGDYIVHCLYDVDNEHIIILEDNTHQPVVSQIETFLEGVRYRDAVNVGGLMFDNSDVEVTYAYIVVDNGLSYNAEAVGLCLVEGAYVEVME